MAWNTLSWLKGLQMIWQDDNHHYGRFSMKTEASNRRYELDWLRVMAILVVFLYHSTRFFNLGDWHIKNVDTFVWVEMWSVFASRWMMPLFFIISGAGLFYSITRSGGWWRFYCAKFQRLMIPVLIGSVTHSVLQVYLERLTHGRFSGSFFSFFPEAFSGVYLAIGMQGNYAFHGMHLWYLLFLFIYSLVCFRLFVWLKGNGRRILNRVAAWLTIPGFTVVGFVIPLVILEVLVPRAVLSVGNGGWGFLYYVWFLIAGFIIFSSDRLQQRIIDQRWITLLLGVGFSCMHLFQLFSPSRLVFAVGIADWLSTLLSFFSAWSWLLTILGFGMRHLAVDRPWLQPANEGVMPFYILHQSALLCIGYFIMALAMHDTLKWLIVFTVSFVVIIVLYRLLIQEIDLLRFLFGMKTTRPGFDISRKGFAVMILTVLYITLIVIAAAGSGRSRAPMPLTYDPDRDVVLNSALISAVSPSGVRVVADEEASNGQAVEFYEGASERTKAKPVVYVEMQFSAPSGTYTVWLRGKTDINSGYTDSVWLQVDDQIGTSARSIRAGNWLDVHPAGIYGWAGDTDDPVSVVLKHSSDHTIRIQPRQTPHRIDQIWLSRSQHRIPNTKEPVK
jgi:Acyltransferase family